MQAGETRNRRLRDRLEALERMRQTLGYTETLRRGYAVVRSGEAVVTSKAKAEAAGALEIEFQDGRMAIGGAPRKKKATPPPPEQGSLL